MPSTNIEPARGASAPSPLSAGIATLSDDECVQRLAHTLDAHDSGHMDELAQLLGRIAVVIE
jgi:hypothetical protein